MGAIVRRQGRDWLYPLGMDVTRARIADLYEQVVSSIDELIGSLREEDWSRATDCPAWTVKDMLAHLSSFEAIASGLAEHAADQDVSALAHAVGFNETVEKDVQARKSWEPQRIAQELLDGGQQHAKALRSISDQDYEAGVTKLPFGEMPSKDILPIRILDLYFHEQDLRRATGNPGHLDGDVARFCFERMRRAIPQVLGKVVGISGDQTVVLNLTSHVGETVAFGIGEGGRVVELADLPMEPTVRIACDLEQFLMLTGGRGDWRARAAQGAISIAGDRDLAERIIDSLAVTP